MVRKAVGRVSLVEALLPAAFGSNQRLERIRAQVDWQPIEARCCSPCAAHRQGGLLIRRWCSSRRNWTV